MDTRTHEVTQEQTILSYRNAFFITNYFQLPTLLYASGIYSCIWPVEKTQRGTLKLHSTDTPGSWLEPQGLQGCPPVDTPFLQGNSYTHRHLFSTFNMCAISYTLSGIYTVTSYNLIIRKVKKGKVFHNLHYMKIVYLNFIHSLTFIISVNEYKKRDW